MSASNMATITASLERSLQNCSLNNHRNSGVLGGSVTVTERSSSSDDVDASLPAEHTPNSDTTLELNSHLSLPYHWEQCLDLKGRTTLDYSSRVHHALQIAAEKLLNSKRGLLKKRKTRAAPPSETSEVVRALIAFPDHMLHSNRPLLAQQLLDTCNQNRNFSQYHIRSRKDVNHFEGVDFHHDSEIAQTGEIYYINWRNGMKAKDDPRITQEDNGDFYSRDDSSYDSEESSSKSSASSTREPYRLDKKDHVLIVAGCKSCLMYFMVPKQVEDCPKCNGQLLHFDRSFNDLP